MREVRGVPARDLVIDRATGQRGKAGEIKKISVNFHKQDADTARAELKALKEKLGLMGIDIDSLPDALPGAKKDKTEEDLSKPLQLEVKTVSAPSPAEDSSQTTEKPGKQKAGK